MSPDSEQDTEPLGGKIGIGNILTEYLYDTGACKTVINEGLYYRLLLTYDLDIRPCTNKISTCNGTMYVLGKITVPKCTLASDVVIENVDILVAKDLKQYECIMGRDLLAKIPCLQKSRKLIRQKVQNMTASLEACWQSRCEEEDNIIYSGFAD